MSGTRSFVAVELSEDVRERLRGVRMVLSSQAPAWRDEKWVAPDNLHLTLKFLGNLADVQLAQLRTALAETFAGTMEFELCLTGLRPVPGARRCSMIWATFDDADRRCTELAAVTEQAARSIDVPRDDRTFAPHVTLVRARHPRRLHAEALSSANVRAMTPAISMSVRSVTLFASTLTRTGPVYEAIDSWALEGAG